jgi:biotin operon repressor
MSFQAMSWAVKQKLPTREKFILIMLANYADENNFCWPSNKKLCDDTSMSKNTLLAGIRALVKAGLIDIIKRNQDGYTLPNKYKLHSEPVGSNSEPVSTLDLNGGGSNSEPKPINKPIKGTNIYITPKKEFDCFWQRYPRKIGKLAARAAFDKAIKLTDFDTIMNATVDFASSRKGQDESYTPHPATWLNQGRWEDEPIKEAKPKERDLRGIPDYKLSNDDYWKKRIQMKEWK